MKKEEITSEHVLEICKFYRLHLGGHLIDEYIENRLGELDRLMAEVQQDGQTEMYRIGSKYTPHSKFGFKSDWQTKDIFPDVYLNFDPKNRQEEKYIKRQKEL